MTIKQTVSERWAKFRESWGDDYEDWREDVSESGPAKRVAFAILVCALIFVSVMGYLWDTEPEIFSVRDSIAQASPSKVVTGVATTSTIIRVTSTLLDKPGGLLSNDIMPPGVWMDNIPNWEYGVLIQVRDISKAMREAFSRSQSQSTEDKSLARAESRFNFDHRSWAIPASESEYRDGIKYLNQYLLRLSDNDQYSAQFFARADNLNYWLSTVETRLGSLSQRLSASVGKRRLNTDLAGSDGATQSTATPTEVDIKTPWNKVDDVFYEARGSAWALLHFLKAVEVDFAPALAKKGAHVSLQQIIRELEATQDPIFSPIILNGDGFGILANHSLVMASYISRAHAAISDLRRLLSEG